MLPRQQKTLLLNKWLKIGKEGIPITFREPLREVPNFPKNRKKKQEKREVMNREQGVESKSSKRLSKTVTVTKCV